MKLGNVIYHIIVKEIAYLPRKYDPFVKNYERYLFASSFKHMIFSEDSNYLFRKYEFADHNCEHKK